jgi:hypothetical protein
MATTSKTQVVPKIYHLLESPFTSVKMFQKVGQQRVRLENKRNDRPYLQIGFMDKDGVNRVIRFKLNCNTPYQDEQIEKHKIPANAKFTPAEMNMLRFKNGVLVLTNASAQNFFDIHPQNEKFEGECTEIKSKLFKEFDPAQKKNEEVSEIIRRAEAVNKILAMSLDEMQSTLIRLYGISYKAPQDKDDCITELVKFMDNANDKGLEALLREGKTFEDEVVILIGKAMGSGLIDFNASGMENFVVKRKNGQMFPVKEISSRLPLQERKRQFTEFVMSNDGRLLLEDLRKECAVQVEAKSLSEVKVDSSGKLEDEPDETITEPKEKKTYKKRGRKARVQA